MIRVMLLVLSVLVLFGSQAIAQPLDSDFVQVQKKRAVILENCPLFNEVESVTVGKAGKTLGLSDNMERRPLTIRRRYRFFACATDEEGQVKIYVKAKATSQPKALTLTLKKFPSKSTPVANNCQQFPGSFIYKTVGSSHFSDVRRNTIGLILRYGAPGPYPSCVSVEDSSGKVVAKMGLYARGAGWAARYYAGIGCGSGTPLNGSAIAARAKRNTGKTTINLDFGNRCYGPIEANRCIGSSQC